MLLGAAATLLAGCEPPTDPLPPSEGRLLIQAVLDLGTSVQLISLRRTGRNIASLDEEVSGANVTITGPDGVAWQAEEIANPGFRRANYFVNLHNYVGATLVPGGTYTLRVVTPEGEVATGTTTIPHASPGPFDSTTVPHFVMTRDTLRLHWPRVAGAKSYQMTIVGRQHFDEDVLDFVRYSAFADTSITLAGTHETIEHDEVFVPSDTITVLAAAVDENYYTYYHVFIDPFAGAPPSRLVGAIGVFGSVVPLVRRRYFVSY
jgi:hypothetical protein